MARKANKLVRKEKNFVKMMFVAALYVATWVFLMTIAVVISFSKVKASNNGDRYALKVPVMSISLNDVTLTEVHENGKEIKYLGNTVELDGVTFENVEFKGRGNYSWAVDKKSYRIKLDKKVELLGMNKSKKWALIANSVDDSMIRNDLAYYLTDLIVDGDYPFRGEYVWLEIDGEDLGLYYLIQTMDIGKQAVKLDDPMGVLVEMDNVYCKEEEKWYETKDGNCLTVKSAVADDNVDDAMKDYMEKYDALEKAVDRGDFSKAEELADMKSFAEYYLITEISANPDAYATSWFFYKNGVTDKIHAGLTWDFDASFGNYKWGKGMCEDEFYAPTVETVHMTDGTLRSSTINFSDMLYKLMNLSEFRELVLEVYSERLLGKNDEILKYIDIRSDEIREAAKRNTELWGGEDFDTSVDYLKWWIIKRIEYFESKFADYI